MSKTSSKVRNKWNAKNYDRLNLTIPKGWAEILKQFCAERGRTVNATVTEVIRAELEEYKKEKGIG